MGLCQCGRHLKCPWPFFNAQDQGLVRHVAKVRESRSRLEKPAELNTREGPLLSLSGGDISQYSLCAPLTSWVASI